MSMAGASGERWAHRTHPSCMAADAVEALDAADAAGDMAAARAPAPTSSAAIVASRAECRKSLIVTYPLNMVNACRWRSRLRAPPQAVGLLPGPPSAARVGSGRRIRCAARPGRLACG